MMVREVVCPKIAVGRKYPCSLKHGIDRNSQPKPAFDAVIAEAKKLSSEPK
jgi:hypothetical protein